MTTLTRGTRSMAPEAALAKVPVEGGELRSGIITATAPKAADERRMAPTL